VSFRGNSHRIFNGWREESLRCWMPLRFCKICGYRHLIASKSYLETERDNTAFA